MRAKSSLDIFLIPLVMALVFFSLYSLNTSAKSDNSFSYLCIGESAIGYSSEDNWNVTRFTVSDKKYIVHQNSNGNAWEVELLGDKPLRYSCDEKGNTLYCSPAGLSQVTLFFLNKNELKFLSAHLLGYWLSNYDDPVIIIGRCTKLTY